MRKIRNFILQFLIITFIVIFIFDFLFSNDISYNLEVSPNPTINEVTTINLTTKYHQKLYTPEKIKIDIYNKHNKAEDFTFEDIKTYQPGTYKLFITPNYSGEYIINVSLLIDGENLDFSTTFMVK